MRGPRLYSLLNVLLGIRKDGFIPPELNAVDVAIAVHVGVGFRRVHPQPHLQPIFDAVKIGISRIKGLLIDSGAA